MTVAAALLCGLMGGCTTFETFRFIGKTLLSNTTPVYELSDRQGACTRHDRDGGSDCFVVRRPVCHERRC